MLYHPSMTIPSWLPVIVPSVGLIVSISALLWQVHRARFNQSVDLLFRLEGDFFGTAKRLQRVKASKDLLEGRSLEAEPILDFFETMALLLRRGALDQELVKHTFFYWVDHYYEASKNIIAERQRKNPLIWKDLVAFVATMRSLQAKQLGVPTYNPPNLQQITEFLAEEQTEAS
jgi:hypothetical protein